MSLGNYCTIYTLNNSKLDNTRTNFTNIAPFSDIPMFKVKYLAMHKVHMLASAISKFAPTYD